jgi:hypothetical protein
MEYRRLNWRPRGHPTSIPTKEVAPRIAVITAIDNFGRLYMAMTQTNTDRWVFSLFVTRLLCKLQAEDPRYRENLVLLLDNAGYHKEAEVMERLKLQGIDVVYTGPYSWSMAPCELLFSRLKAVDLNPERLATGKLVSLSMLIPAFRPSPTCTG